MTGGELINNYNDIKLTTSYDPNVPHSILYTNSNIKSTSKSFFE